MDGPSVPEQHQPTSFKEALEAALSLDQINQSPILVALQNVAETLPANINMLKKPKSKI
jgi:hypothetical protein